MIYLNCLKKETIITEDSSRIFLYSPYIAFGIYSLIALIIPVFMTDPITETGGDSFSRFFVNIFNGIYKRHEIHIAYH